MIWSLPAARAGCGPIAAKSSANVAIIAIPRFISLPCCIFSPTKYPERRRIAVTKSERMSTVRTHHEKKLKQKLVCVGEVSGLRERQMPEAILSTDLTELAGP